MEKAESRIFEEFCPYVEPGIVEYIEMFLESEELVERYEVKEGRKGQIDIHATLVNFTFVTAKKVFLELSELVRRSFFNVYVGEEQGEQVRYLYITGMSGRDGIKIEMVIN